MNGRSSIYDMGLMVIRGCFTAIDDVVVAMAQMNVATWEIVSIGVVLRTRGIKEKMNHRLSSVCHSPLFCDV